MADLDGSERRTTINDNNRVLNRSKNLMNLRVDLFGGGDYLDGVVMYHPFHPSDVISNGRFIEARLIRSAVCENP